ncbi:amino-acid N-acetyltransferase [Thiorhodovibrio frisius]|uniref:Amino-acid acetyltransferase n=1 Tax=Thiorhodovibrio frisius TaxID=631362 RepID=H8Z056_9GAMM|nr:amino-acid N-acetyltransferase [Thiorhodovibrio frisius]EIC22264.1 amino-acid N-acetyltransferase [Thiorhodovibrio frisius]WPL24559.1 Amino-acid acetyltransferase [Thiorhodovibrio frisius]
MTNPHLGPEAQFANAVETSSDPGISNPGDPFVAWFRQCTPYVHAHRDRTFVICFGGEAIADPGFPNLVHDFALLHGLGIRLVLVHGARPQIEQRLARQGAQMRYLKGLRVTDEPALACVKEAAGVARVEIEALLSLGLANSPMAGVRIPVASGNFVTARPLGVLNGVDYQHTGAVRRIDRAALRQRLEAKAVALIPPLGYSPTGEVFNLSAADVACSTAVGLSADKLIFLLEPGWLNPVLGAQLPLTEVDQLLTNNQDLPEETAAVLRASREACRRGIRRVHLIERARDGALLRELFTRDGSGTLISSESFEEPRPARLDDVAGIQELLAPLERKGLLVSRSRERLESDIGQFQITEQDGTILSCAALFPYLEAGLGELACVAVHGEYRGSGRGDRMLAHMEQLARQRGLKGIFVLTTQTAHWFRERGFEPAGLEVLPQAKRANYKPERNSQIYLKNFED